MSPQLKKGFLEYCILAVLKRGDSYGYQIIKDMNEVIEIPESTLYPILKRLEGKKYINSYTKLYDGRARKYYRITDLGIEGIKLFLSEQQEVDKIYEFIRKGINHD